MEPLNFSVMKPFLSYKCIVSNCILSCNDLENFYVIFGVPKGLLFSGSTVIYALKSVFFSGPIKFSPIHIDVLKLSRKGSLGDDVAMATGEEVKHKSQ